MIRLEFYSVGDKLSGFRIKGHSGLETEGKDILCAAVTGAVRLTETCINDVLGTGAAVKINNTSAQIDLTLPDSLSLEQDDVCQALLTALMLLCVQLHDEYPENIEVYEL